MSGRNWVRLDHDAEDRGLTYDFVRCIWGRVLTDEMVAERWLRATKPAEKPWLQWLLHGAGHQHPHTAMHAAYRRKKRGWR